MGIKIARSGIHAVGSATPTSGSVLASAIQANPKRTRIELQSGATGFYYGYGTITTSNGIFLAGGTVTRIIEDYTGPVFVVTASGTVTFAYAEVNQP